MASPSCEEPGTCPNVQLRTGQADEEPYSIFDRRQKRAIIGLVSVAATFSGFASNIYFPAIPAVARDLGVSLSLANLSVTTYLIFQGLAPSLWGPVSDAYGRRVAYCSTFFVFVGACIGLAETTSYAALLVLRCLQSTGSASTIAIGSGVLADVTTRAERGGYMAVFQAGLLTPVAVGPLIGGALAGSLGWHSVFWFLAIYAAVFLVFLIILLPETLRLLVANGSRTPSHVLTRHPLSLYQRTTTVRWTCEAEAASPTASPRAVDVTGPLRILLSKQASPIILFLAIYYAVWQMSITAMSSLFASRYHLSETQIGLTYMANGVGSILGTLFTGRILDRDYQRVKRWHEQQQHQLQQHLQQGQDQPRDQPRPVDPRRRFPLEKARLRLIPVFSLVQCASIVVFGWTVQYSGRVPLAVPVVSTFFSGWTAIGMQAIVTTYLVDVFPDRSAAAGASLNLARCLFAAGGTSFVIPMVDTIGAGWAFTVCLAAMTAGLVGAGLQAGYGGRWREEAAERVAIEREMSGPERRDSL